MILQKVLERSELPHPEHASRKGTVNLSRDCSFSGHFLLSQWVLLRQTLGREFGCKEFLGEVALGSQ